MNRRLRCSMVVVPLAFATSLVLTAPAGATTVDDEAGLRAAFESDTQVDLAADITLTDCSGPDGGAVVRQETNTDPVTLDGHGFTITQACPSSVFNDRGTGALTIRGATITGGHSQLSGGGVFTNGDLTVEGSVITSNFADQFGGGLVSNGAMVVRSSSIVGNGAGHGGGGLQAFLSVTVTDSNVSENLGGGIGTSVETSAQVTVINSTVHHNTRAGLGGGISTGGSATLIYATITDNQAEETAGNLFVGPLTSFGSVVTGAVGTTNCLIVPGGVSLGYNVSADETCKFTAPTDRQNVSDPLLGPLADNGGPTATQLPQPGSPLLDAIPADACAPDITTDQRGVARPQNDSCDIGAVEVEAVASLTPEEPEPAAAVTATPRFTG